MSTIPFLTATQVEDRLSWKAVSNAMRSGHLQTRADIDGIFFKQGDNSLLNRAAWIKGQGISVKTATIFSNNLKHTPALPSIHAVFALFDDETGVSKALIDGTLVTNGKRRVTRCSVHAC